MNLPAPGKAEVSILLVEDQGSMRKAMRRVIEKMDDFTPVIDEFSNGREAMRQLNRKSYDILVTDLYMPYGSGLDLIATLRGRAFANDIPILVVSGEAQKEDIVLAAQMGASDYLLKPFEVSDFSNKFRQVLEKARHPDEKTKRLRKAENLCLMGQYKDAKTLFLKVLETDSTSSRALVGLAQSTWKLGDPDGAAILLREAQNNNPQYFPAWSVSADLNHSQGFLSEAILNLKRELAINGKQPDRRGLLADWQFKDGNHKEAIENMHKALQERGTDEDLLLRMARMQFELKHLDKSLHYYMKTRRAVPDSRRALEGIHFFCKETKQLDKAVRIFTDMLSTKPDQIDVLLERSKVHMELERENDALGDLHRCLTINPEDFESLELKGKVLGKLKRNAEALEVYNTIARMSPTSDNFARVALLHLRLKHYTDASHWYGKALNLHPDNTKFLYNLAFAYENMGFFKKALHTYEQVLKMVPDHKEAKGSVLRLQQLPQVRMAKGVSQKPLASPPQSPKPLGSPQGGSKSSSGLGATKSQSSPPPTKPKAS